MLGSNWGEAPIPNVGGDLLPSQMQARNIPIWSGCVGMLFLAVGIIEHDWAVGMSGYYEGGEVASEVASEVAR